jgi:hypothetical protein
MVRAEKFLTFFNPEQALVSINGQKLLLLSNYICYNKAKLTAK